MLDELHLNLQVLSPHMDHSPVVVCVYFYLTLTYSFGDQFGHTRTQLFRERLSEKVLATIPKGIVGGFEFSVLQRNLKELA